MKAISLLCLFFLSLLFIPTASGESTSDPHPGSATVPITGTLPVMYIHTLDGSVIDQKEKYIQACYWIETPEGSEFQPIGSKDAPLALGIRGRGNASWTYDKKPYKIRLDTKAPLLGMPPSRHWALLNHHPSQGGLIESISFELGRRIGLAWTPTEIPVELMLNGRNVGLYYLTETVRIEPNRVNIYEQPDLNTDLTTISGGWLIEIDNYFDPFQIQIPQTGADVPFDALFTFHSPEILSARQHEWLASEFALLTEMIFTPDKTDSAWTNYIDIESLAKYYIIQELTCNYDAFYGSTYLYKDLDSKWTFGPMWDSGWTFEDSPRSFDFVSSRRQFCPECYNFVWIEEFLKFPVFRQKVSEIWQTYRTLLADGMDDYIDTFLDYITPAYELNYGSLWPEFPAYTIWQLHTIYKERIADYFQWMDQYVSTLNASINAPDCYQSGYGIINITSLSRDLFRVSVDGAILTDLTITDLNGRPVSVRMIDDCTARIEAPPGLYIARGITPRGSTLPTKLLIR